MEVMTDALNSDSSLTTEPTARFNLITMELKPSFGNPEFDDIEAFLDNCYGQNGGINRFCILEKFDVFGYIQTAYDYDEKAKLKSWRLESRIYQEDGTYQHFYATTRDSRSRSAKQIYSLDVIKKAFLNFYTNTSTSPLLEDLEWYEFDLQWNETEVDDRKEKLEKYKREFEEAIADTRSAEEYYRKAIQPELRSNPHQRFAYFWRAARAGYAPAQFLLAKAFENGTGCQKSNQKAAFWYQKAAENGSLQAQYYLGENYYYGGILERDVTSAIKYMKMAADTGDIDAQNALAFMYFHEKNAPQDVDLEEIFERLADDGNKSALLNLGEYYYRGYKEIPADYEKAFDCFSEASGSDSKIVKTIADNFLAFMNYDGKGTEENSVAAMAFWQNQDYSNWETPHFMPDIMQLLAERQSKAVTKARTGDPGEEYELSTFYELGLIGFSKNEEKAVYWLERSAKQEYAWAMNSLADYYRSGRAGKEKDLHKAMSLYLAAYRKKEPCALMNMASIFKNDKKLKCPAITRALYEAAVEEIPEAKNYIKNLKKELSKKQRKKVFDVPAMPITEAIVKIEKVIAEKLKN